MQLFEKHVVCAIDADCAGIGIEAVDRWQQQFEAVRGLWLKFSPQLRAVPGNAFTGQVRMLLEADLLPRTHWNVDASYYHDRSRATDLVTHTFLIQLHLYL